MPCTCEHTREVRNEQRLIGIYSRDGSGPCRTRAALSELLLSFVIVKIWCAAPKECIGYVVLHRDALESIRLSSRVCFWLDCLAITLVIMLFSVTCRLPNCQFLHVSSFEFPLLFPFYSRLFKSNCKQIIGQMARGTRVGPEG